MILHQRFMDVVEGARNLNAILYSNLFKNTSLDYRKKRPLQLPANTESINNALFEVE